jgi:hypothetical protein
MEKLPKKEKISLVEKQRQEALDEVLNILSERFPVELKKTFESHGKEYALTSAEDCMVAFAQQNREAVETLYSEIKEENNYRAEQAIAKLFALFIAYEKTVALYAELRSYYPQAAARVEDQLPPLSAVVEHGSTVWQKMNK